jgi:hypothetical protein
MKSSTDGHKARLCDPSFHSDFKLEELQEYLDRINQPEVYPPDLWRVNPPSAAPEATRAGKLDQQEYYLTPARLGSLEAQRARRKKLAHSDAWISKPEIKQAYFPVFLSPHLFIAPQCRSPNRGSRASTSAQLLRHQAASFGDF